MPRRNELLSIRLPLSHTHPEIAAQALGWDPSLVTYGSGKWLMWATTAFGAANPRQTTS